jgi:sulfur carrier protein
MQIQVNGELRTMIVGTTVDELLNELQIRPDRVAVEVNMEIVERQDFARRALQEGDRVEVIGFIGGGARHSFRIS